MVQVKRVHIPLLDYHSRVTRTCLLSSLVYQWTAIQNQEILEYISCNHKNAVMSLYKVCEISRVGFFFLGLLTRDPERKMQRAYLGQAERHIGSAQ